MCCCEGVIPHVSVHGGAVEKRVAGIPSTDETGLNGGRGGEGREGEREGGREGGISARMMSSNIYTFSAACKIKILALQAINEYVTVHMHYSQNWKHDIFEI